MYVETSAKPARRPYHKQKLALLLSAMRHDALERAEKGHPVLYRFSEKWYDGALAEAREACALERVEALSPAEAEVREPLAALPWLELRPNTLFITDEAFYRSVFPRPGHRRLETFYRAARKRTGLLMEGEAPAGGTWNLDAANRETWKGAPPVPRRPSFPPDALTLRGAGARGESLPALVRFARGVRLAGDGAGRGAGDGALPREAAAVVRALRGRDGRRGARSLPLAPLAVDQPRAPRPPRSLPESGSRLAEEARAARLGRGLRPAGPRLARVRASRLRGAPGGIRPARTRSEPGCRCRRGTGASPRGCAAST